MEIGDKLSVFYFGRYSFLCVFQLLCNTIAPFGKSAAAVSSAEDAAAKTQGAVPIGAGEAAV